MGEKKIHRLRIVEGRPWKEALLCASGGGCCVGEVGKWQCGECGHNWGREEL